MTRPTAPPATMTTSRMPPPDFFAQNKPAQAANFNQKDEFDNYWAGDIGVSWKYLQYFTKCYTFFLIIRLSPDFLPVSVLWCAFTLGAALLCGSRAGSWFGAYIQIWVEGFVDWVPLPKMLYLVVPFFWRCLGMGLNNPCIWKCLPFLLSFLIFWGFFSLSLSQYNIILLRVYSSYNTPLIPGLSLSKYDIILFFTMLHNHFCFCRLVVIPSWLILVHQASPGSGPRAGKIQKESKNFWLKKNFPNNLLNNNHKNPLNNNKSNSNHHEYRGRRFNPTLARTRSGGPTSLTHSPTWPKSKLARSIRASKCMNQNQNELF